MQLNRNTGLTIGFGIGIIIAGVVFGVIWLTKNSGSLLKTQALQENSAPATATPVAQTTTQNAPATTTETNNGDNLVNRLAPSQADVVTGIQENIQQLYGTR